MAIGALSSSAPILQFDNITPWSSFYDAVSQDFKVHSFHYNNFTIFSYQILNITFNINIPLVIYITFMISPFIIWKKIYILKFELN